MNQLRTITRASNWTPDRLRVLSAVVVSADHVSDEPLGRVEGVVLDDLGAIQSFIVKLWENGQATRAVLVPLASVQWYTEGFAPALGISWTPDLLRGQPALAPSNRPHRLSLGPAAAPSEPEAQGARRSPRALIGTLLGFGVAGALGALFADPLLAAALALVLVPLAVIGVRSRPRAVAVSRSSATPERAPWVANLEQSLESAAHFERRVLHFSLLRRPSVGSTRATSRASLPAVPPAQAIAFRKTKDEAPRRIESGTWPTAADPRVRANARASQGG